MALYREFGVIENYQYGLFLEPSWLAVYQGQRIIPRRADLRVNQTQLSAIKPTLAAMRQQIKDQVAKMPLHSEVLASLHPADSTVFTIGNEASLTQQGLNQPANFSLYGQRG